MRNRPPELPLYRIVLLAGLLAGFEPSALSGQGNDAPPTPQRNTVAADEALIEPAPDSGQGSGSSRDSTAQDPAEALRRSTPGPDEPVMPVRPPAGRQTAAAPTTKGATPLPAALLAPDEDLADIEDIRAYPRPLWPWIVGGGAALLLLALVLFVLFRWLSRRPRTTLRPSAYARARSRLAEARSHLARQNEERFAVAASGAIRDYLEECFGLPAPELTTEEFLRRILSESFFSEEERGRLVSLLEACDLAKFARQPLGEARLEAAWADAEQIIESLHRKELSAPAARVPLPEPADPTR